MYLYNKLVLRIRETALTQVFDYKKEVRKLVNNYIIAFLALGAGFILEAWRNMIASTDLWIQVSIISCLSVIYFIGLVVVIVANIRSFWSYIFAYGYLIIEAIFLSFLHTVFPVVDKKDVYIIMMSVDYLAFNALLTLRIRILKKQIKLGLVIPQIFNTKEESKS